MILTIYQINALKFHLALKNKGNHFHQSNQKTFLRIPYKHSIKVWFLISLNF